MTDGKPQAEALACSGSNSFVAGEHRLLRFFVLNKFLFDPAFVDRRRQLSDCVTVLWVINMLQWSQAVILNGCPILPDK